MKKKLIIAVLLVCALVLPLLAACDNTPATSPTPSSGGTPSTSPTGPAEPTPAKVTLWSSGGDNCRVTWEALIADFAKTDAGKYYTIDLEFIVSGTGVVTLTDRVGAAIEAGQTNTDFDLLDVGEDSLGNYTAATAGGTLEEIFLKLDTSKLSNFDKLVSDYGTENQGYGVPYRATAVVLAYNKDTVTNVPTTFDEVLDWVKANPGRVAYTVPEGGGGGRNFAMTAVYKFLPDDAIKSGDASNIDKWEQGWQLLTELHPYFYRSGGKIVYPGTDTATLELLGNKEIDMCSSWADQLLSQVQGGTMPKALTVTTVSPGFGGSLVGLSATTIGHAATDENVLAACYAFMDYTLSVDAQNILVGTMAAMPVVDTATLSANVGELFGAADLTNFRIFTIGDLNTQFKLLWNEKIAPLCETVKPVG